MPGLARLTLERGYLGEFLFQLSDDRIASFSPQRLATCQMLEYVRRQMPDEVERWMAESELENRIATLHS